MRVKNFYTMNTTIAQGFSLVKHSLFHLLVLFAISGNLSAQEIPYRKGKLWGYADTLGQIVIPPIYDNIRKIPNKKYFRVKKGSELALINHKNEMIVPYTRNDIEVDRYISVYDVYDNGAGDFYHLDNLKRIFPEHLKTMLISKKRELFMVQTKQELIGLAQLDKDLNVHYLVDTLSAYKYQDKDFSTQTLFLLDANGKVKHFDMKQLKFVDPQSRSERTYHAPSAPARRRAQPKRKKKPVIVAYENEFKVKTLQDDELVESDMVYDSVLLIAQNTSSYSTIKKSWLLVSKNGQQGLLSEDGKVVLPLDYDQIGNCMMYSQDKYIIFVRKGRKWGAIDEYGEVILDIEYDEIPIAITDKESDIIYRRQFLCFAVKQGNSYGLFNAHENQKPAMIYDTITRIDVRSKELAFQMAKDDKHGFWCGRYVKKDGKNIPVYTTFEAKYKHPISDFTFVNGHSVLNVHNAKGGFRGYMDLRGNVYFED